MPRACPRFVEDAHKWHIQTPDVATRVALIAYHHLGRSVSCPTHKAVKRGTTEVALGVHVGVKDGERAMGDVLDLLLSSGRVTPLQYHCSAWPNLHNT